MPRDAKVAIPDEVKAEIVTRFAFFESPSSVQDWLKKDHELEVPFPQLAYYNPDLPSSTKLGKRWRDLHARMRAQALVGLEKIGVAQQTHRLRLIDGAVDRIFRWADRLAEKNNLVGAVNLLREGKDFLETAAKERGGSFSNKHELTGKDGKDLPVGAVVILPAAAPLPVPSE